MRVEISAPVATEFEVNATDGTPLRLYKWGTRAKACLLIHGFGDGAHVWDDLIRPLLGTYTVYALDLRGHGCSGWSPDGDYGVAAYVNDVIAVLDTISAREPMVLIGHSLGAEIALRIGFAQPWRISGLVLVDYGPALNQSAIDVIHFNFSDSFGSFESPAALASRLMMLLPLAESGRILRYAEKALQKSRNGEFAPRCDPRIGAVREPQDPDLIWAMLIGLNCPLLVIRGFCSAVLPAETFRRMGEVLSQAEFAVVSRSGHAVMLDNPEGFRLAVLPFMRRQLIRGAISVAQ